MRLLPSFRGITPTNTTNRYIDEFLNDFDRRFFERNSASGNDMTIPSANIQEIEDEDRCGYQIALAAPGYEKEDFSIEVNHQRLIISATREQETEQESRYSRQEYNYHSFDRAFVLPESTVEENITANYRNGVLSIFVPIKNEEEEVVSSHRIEVQGA